MCSSDLDFMGRIGDLIILNVLFIITSIPIVTIGASFTALYQVILKLYDKEEKETIVVRSYIRSFKEHFKRSTLIWLVLLIVGALLIFDVLYIGNLEKNIF